MDRVRSALAFQRATVRLEVAEKYNPFITTAYMRHGAFNGMNRRDWTIFLGSWLLSNLIWIAVCAGGIEAARAMLGG